MNILREGGSVLRPPLLEGSNYSYWKARMRAFLKSVDKKAWKSVVFGWQHPIMENEKKKILYNSKALNAIFSAVDSNQFWLIATCETVKEAWDILQIDYKGTASVRLSELQMLASRFEDLRMEDNETIANFNAKLCNIANECHALGEKSLPDRFAHKVTAIDEAKDVTIMRLDELMDKGITLQAEAHETEDNAQIDDHDMTDPVVLLTQNFQKFFASNSSSFSNDRKDKRIQCRECEGYGHIQSECANTLKKKKGMSLNITWSDADSYDNQEEHDDAVSNRVFMPNKIKLSNLENVMSQVMFKHQLEYRVFQKPVLTLFQKVKKKLFKVFLLMRFLTAVIVELTCQTTELQHELNQFKLQIVENDMLLKSTTAELEIAKASLSRINTGKAKLDEILSTGQVGGNRQGIGYIGECSNTKMDPKLKIEFVKSTVVKPSIFDSGKKKVFQKPQRKRYVPICHYYHIPGHIRPKCFKLNVRISFSGYCSRHMTSNKSNLSDFQSIEKGRVTIGDGVSGQILGKGILDVKGLHRLKNVLLIEGLKTKLISISQLCYQNLFVHFTNDLCHVFDNTNYCVMTGKRSVDNCYLLKHEKSCLNVTHDETEIWHQKLGHLNFKSLSKLVNTGTVLGVPKLSKKKDGVCGPCQLEKQKHVSHPMFQHVGTSWILELLHMDLMGPIQVESLSGKKYVFVCVDDFSNKYARNLVKKFGLENTKHIKTPMGTNNRLSKDYVGISVGTSLYRGMIVSLLYLTASRPDIYFSVGVCARYQSNPKDSHLKAVKRIIRYVNGTSDYGIWYSKDTNSNLAGYCDADWVGDMDDRKTTSGGCFFLGNNLISWFSKKQNCVSLSTVESEYIASKRGKPSGVAACIFLAPKIPIEPEVDAVPLAIEYPPLEITSEPYKDTPIAKEEQVTELVQRSSLFHTPATSLANTAKVAETLMDFHQGQGTDPIGEEAHHQGSTGGVPVRSPVRTCGRTTQIPEEFKPQGNIHVSISDNSSKDSAQGNAMDVDSDKIVVSKVVSHKFYLDYANDMWECVSKRKLWSERSIRLSDFEDRGLDSILIDRQLIGSMTDIKPYVPQVVKEFYCNLHSDIIKADSGRFGQAAMTNWTPTANHTVLVKDQAIILYCIGTGHPYDLGRHIMRTITKHAEVKTTTGHLPFPSLIYNMLMSQGFRSLGRNNWNILERKKFYILLPNSKVLLTKVLLLLNHFPWIVLALLLRHLVLRHFLVKKKESVVVAGVVKVDGTFGARGVHAEPGVAAVAEIGEEALDIEADKEA
ncbi:hypothetical protein Pfo_000335 [Paulownia fortunei]|nr:hypothetical protein Pfo_000335 [Paulownia fortunei]